MQHNVISTENGTHIPVSYLEGTVVSAATRTEFTTRQTRTVVQGTKVTPGQVYNEASQVDDVWLQLDNGKEAKLPFQTSLVDVLAGHRVIYAYGTKSDNTKVQLGARNFNTEEVRTSQRNCTAMAADPAAKSKKPAVGFWATTPLAYLGGMAMNDFSSYMRWNFFLAGAFWTLVVLAVIAVYRRSRLASAQGSAARDILKSHLQSLPAERPSQPAQATGREAVASPAAKKSNPMKSIGAFAVFALVAVGLTYGAMAYISNGNQAKRNVSNTEPSTHVPALYKDFPALPKSIPVGGNK